MITLNFFTRPFFWLVMYLLALVCFGLVYLNSMRDSVPLRLTGTTVSSSADAMITAKVQGLGLEDLPAYLTLDAVNQRAIVGNVPVSSLAADIEIVNGEAFVVSQTGGVNIFDLSLPTKPVMIGRRETGGRGWRSSTDGNYLYISSLRNGLLIYPVSMKGRSHVIFESALATVSRGQQVFIASGKTGLSIYEFSQRNGAPPKSRLLSRLALPGFTWDLAYSGDSLVAASMSGGLHLVDISDSENPRVLQTISDRKNYDKVWWIGDIVYASVQYKQLDIFRSTENRLIPCGSIPLTGRVKDFLLDGERLYLAESSFGVSVLDVSDPEHPKRIGFVGTPGEAVGLALDGRYLYVASSSQGVQIVDTERFAPLNVLASFGTENAVYGLVLDGRWIYIADGPGGFQVVDRSDKNNLKLVATHPTRSRAVSIAKAGDLVFVALFDNSLVGFDVSEPLMPKQVSRLILNARTSDMVGSGSSLFVSSVDGKLLKIDISDPLQPQVSESLELPGQLRSISVEGDYVFIAAGKAGLLVTHFPQHQPGRLIGRLTRPWPMSDFSQASGIVVRGNYAYLIQGRDGLQIVDISNPEKPEEVEFIPLPARGLSIGMSEAYVVVSTLWNGYYFIDISRPAKPFLAANIFLPRGSSEFEIEENRLYATGQTLGINVVPLPIKNTRVSRSSGLDLTFGKPQHPGWYDLSISDGKKIVSRPSVLKVE